MKKSSSIVALLVVGLLFMQFAWLQPPTGETDRPDFARHVNLALRRTAHHLLRRAGDSTSQIPPVQQPVPGTFQVQLDHVFNYEQLPALLHQSLAIHAITDRYDVAILDCTTGILQLGYTAQDLLSQGTVPCTERDRKPGCHILQISFIKSAPVSHSAISWGLWVVGFVVLSGAYIIWQKPGNKSITVSAPIDTLVKDEPVMRIGKLAFDFANQTADIAGKVHTLTYREAKLLHLFVRHPNHLLTRDFILKSVWEDEGIIVGRSIDVFVSRLRKILKQDSGLRITAVHGVGYQLEVQA